MLPIYCLLVKGITQAHSYPPFPFKQKEHEPYPINEMCQKKIQGSHEQHHDANPYR